MNKLLLCVVVSFLVTACCVTTSQKEETSKSQSQRFSVEPIRAAQLFWDSCVNYVEHEVDRYMVIDNKWDAKKAIHFITGGTVREISDPSRTLFVVTEMRIIDESKVTLVGEIMVKGDFGDEDLTDWRILLIDYELDVIRVDDRWLVSLARHEPFD